jgi:hypothetical protein
VDSNAPLHAAIIAKRSSIVKNQDWVSGLLPNGLISIAKPCCGSHLPMWMGIVMS